MSECRTCAATVTDGDAFCEACGAPLGPDPTGPVQSDPAQPDAVQPDPAQPDAVEPDAVQPAGLEPDSVQGEADLAVCRACGGAVEDGYCTQCGARAPSPRDHFEEHPADWVAGVCDKGKLHARNEDGMAVAVTAAGVAVLVVCDGVTTAPESDRASLAAARAAAQALTGASLAGAPPSWDVALRAAARAANAEAVGVAKVLGNPSEPPSCTFVAAVVVGGTVHVAWCGDSRAYWVPDNGEPVALTVDHSLGTELIRGGMSPDEAEHDPSFHTITRWLGADSLNATPDIGAHPLDGAGWVVVASDGLWNYASTPEALAAALSRAVTDDPDPLAVARHMVAFANDQGGHDNITVAVARHGAHVD